MDRLLHEKVTRLQLVQWLEELTRNDIAVAGGKGANLGELLRAGFPVPRGFVLLTGAYHTFVRANDLQPDIERIVQSIRPDDMSALESASTDIRDLFGSGNVPANVEDALVEAYEVLGAGPVAVRSSATAEDLPTASFAGQQETFLNVSGTDRLVEAVQRCWSSLWTPRALSYRARQEVATQGIGLAVVVQKMVHAEAAGVMFTANPVTGHRHQVVIDGAWGLGESVVSGQVTPDHWVVNPRDSSIVEQTINQKQVETVETQSGTQATEVDAERASRPVLTHEQLAELVHLGCRAADHFGAPQDLEWALQGKHLFIVQSRPITSLYPLPKPRLAGEPGLRVYLSMNSLQGLVAPLTPMGISVFRHLGRGIQRPFHFHFKPEELPPAVKSAGMRLFMDVTNVIRHPRTRALPLALSHIADNPMSTALRTLLEDEERLDPVPGRSLPIRPRPGFALRTLTTLITTLFSPDTGRRRIIGRVNSWVARLEEEAALLNTFSDRMEFVRTTTEAMVGYMLSLLPVLVVGVAPRFIAERLLQEWLGHDASIEPVLRSLPHNPTTEMDIELWRVSRRLKDDGATPTLDHPVVRDFLNRYGHRAVREIDVGAPRWSEDPGHILDVLRSYMSRNDETDPEQHFMQGAREAERARAGLVARVRQKKGPAQAWAIRFLLTRIRQLAGVRERPKFLAVRVLAMLRHVLQDIGRDLVRQGRLDDAGDVFFVGLEDIRTRADLRQLARTNHETYSRELTQQRPPRIMTSEGVTLFGSAVAAEGALVGIAASAGVYRGPVRVVLAPRGSELQAGEVLVAPGTDPAWTPLFLSAGALVMEIGGIMSHGSVVAREYGIPAVVGIADATHVLKTGQWVLVDGDAGHVVPIDEPVGDSHE